MDGCLLLSWVDKKSQKFTGWLKNSDQKGAVARAWVGLSSTSPLAE
jgi:hypothetical protein